MTLDKPCKPVNARPSTTTNTPKPAGKGPQTPSNGKSQLSTPTPVLRMETKGGRINATAVESKKDGVTPMKTLLSANITPRSGSRKARVESASSTPKRTPESTPPVARPSSMIEGRDWPLGGPKVARELGSRCGNVSRPARAQSVVSDVQHPVRFSPAGSDRGDNGSRNTSPETLPKFFHANEAKPSWSAKPQSQSPRLQPRLAGFDYANGASKLDISALSASPEPEDNRPKFFHADGTSSASPPVSRLVDGAFAARPPLHTIFSSYQTTNNAAQRPPSPLKEEVLPIPRKSSLSKPSPRRHTRLVSSGSNDIRAPDTLVKGQSDISRRSSLNDGARRISQPQSPITGSFGKTTSRRSSIALSDSGRQSASIMPPKPTSTETLQTEPANMMSPESISTSPSKPAPAQSKLDHLNELAANARRERKVLDLEISNSSLLAINRTLEAEMRKQKGELRHLRRLRSSGRFPSSTRSASSRFSMPSAGDDLSPTSSADEDGLDDDRFSNLSSGTSDDTSFPDSLSFSPTLRNSALPVAKGRRSRCFKLDLSAQRSLLLDSQKLNQALKRCLGRTDELIADGKKALEYKVNTGDVANLGPRVLTPEERDEELELGRGLLSPGFEGKAENPWERIRSSQPGKLEGLMLHIPAGRNRDNVDDQKQVHGPSIGQEVLGPKAQESADRVQQDPDINTVPEPRTIEAPVTDAASTDEPTTPGKLNIPYEDPGIDTGSDTQPLDNNVGEIGAHREDSSSESTAPEEEPRISSPGKGLGDFLRIVGGSWGV